MAYLIWDTKKINDFSPDEISGLYNKGFVFTRKGKGEMYRTRSLRIDLSKFSTHTKNKRILRKTADLQLQTKQLPLPIAEYNWQIHKLGKDYYDQKFGENIFSASKIKELLTDSQKSNYNLLLCYTEKESIVGYVIAYQNDEMIHYAYPFYDLEKYFNHYGMGMMLRAILFAKESGRKYFYLGSVSRPADIYKLYFRGLEWNDGQVWRVDIEFLKGLIQESKISYDE